MEQLFDVLSHLEVRFLEGLPPKSNNQTPTGVFQFVARDTSKFLVQVDPNFCLQFQAFYQHKGKFYPHPYTLQKKVNCLMNNTLSIDYYQQTTYEISLYLELKRLQDFEIDDLKRYYEAIDQTIDSNEELHDFHDIYLILKYEINGQSTQYQCNNGQPIHLPKFISNPWTHKNTSTRFRYDAENRDGIFPCEMMLRCENILNLQSYKIVLCLTSNTIPARMDYHAIRWLCKLKPKVSKQNGSSMTRHADKEKPYCLSHQSGIVIAQVFGPDLKFTPQMIYPINNLNYVRSYFEPENFQTELKNSDHKDIGALAIVVVKGTDYPIHMKNRRKDKNILRYLPFKEFDNIDNNLEIRNEEIIKRLKIHKEQCSKQLIFYDENERGTYSQAHVRLYVAAYNENDVLLTEALHPPLRNNKTFEQLRIIRIVQPKYELHAYEPAFVYCDYDYSKLKSEHDTCPYEFELVFTDSLNIPNTNQLLTLFNKPNICTRASYVPNCPCLLQFQVPNDSRYHKHRIFIRLRHTQSKDYNPSAIALDNDQCWIYHADPTSVIDMMLENDFTAINDSSRSNPINLDQTFELQIRPLNQPLLLQDSTIDTEDSDAENNHLNRILNTPTIESTISRRFLFPNASTPDYNHE